MKKFILFVIVLLTIVYNNVSAQDVFDPNDPLVTYDSTNPPVKPPMNVIGKWVRTPHKFVTGWDATKFKAYIYNDMAFRLRYPNNFNKADNTKKYPLVLFLHGGGEIGPITDNDFHLLLGARRFQDMINNGKFNGYLFFPQQVKIGWDAYYPQINNIIDSLVKYGNVDPDRVTVMGLSIGGFASLHYAKYFPERAAASIPSSPAFIGTFNESTEFLHIPVWLGSGGRDTNPNPFSVTSFVNAFTSKGGSIRHSFFPFADHDSWNPQWADETYLANMWNTAHKATPHVFFNRRDFCPDTALNVKIGISPGFVAYEWQRDNSTIAISENGVHTIIDHSHINTFTGNDITVKSFGTYRVRFKRSLSGDWSVWSPVPALLTQKSLTASAPIKITGLKSKVLPAIDGSTTVPLELPAGYAGYEWRNVSDSVVVSSERTYAAPVGQYIARVKQEGGCYSPYAPMFTVISANGNPKPDAPKNLAAYPASETSIQLEWTENASPMFNETGFEVYRGTSPGGPYSLIAITAADVKTYIDTKLSAQTTYYYKIRAISETGASSVSNEASAKTINDIIAPTAPANLKADFTSRNFIDLSWNSSTDNVGIYKYDIYIDGVKRYTTSDTTFKVINLEPLKTFNFTVKARDLAGNTSPASKQVTASTVLGGLKYKYYEGIWSFLPDFNTLTPVFTGVTPNIDITTLRRPGRINFFAFLFEGYIYMPVAGTYTFSTKSNDGTNVYVKSLYDPAATPVVSDDGVKGVTTDSGTVTIDAPGYYPIAVSYFLNLQGGEILELYWTGPAGSGISRQLVPTSAFTDTYTIPGTIPTAPSGLTATGVAYDRINLSWTDNSTNETGFEVSRATTLTGIYASIGTVKGSTFADSNRTANTTYYYRVRAVGTAGESAYAEAQGTSLAAPAMPTAPGGLTATVISTNQINISWNDLSSNETGFQVYRSTYNGSNYRLIATLPAGSTGYEDKGLFSSTTYFYKVKAIVTGNASAFSNEASGKTGNTRPSLKDVPDFTMKYGTSLTLPVTATDADNDNLRITTSRLPRFAKLISISNGNVALQLDPQDVNRGNYPIKVYVDDFSGGYDTISFLMIVNNNSVPTLADINNVSVDEAASLQVNMTAQDAETTSAINWTFEGLPSFATFTKDSSGHGTILLMPGYAQSGTYPVTVRVDDGYGAWVTKSFSITVNEKEAGKLWLINMKKDLESPKTPLYWNDVQKGANNAINSNNLKTVSGVATTAGVHVPAGWNLSFWPLGAVADPGAVYTGVYPANVILDAAYFGVDTIDLNITNLNPLSQYNFKFLSSSNTVNHTGYTGFKFGTKKDSVAMIKNFTNKARLDLLSPNAAGTINIKVYRTAGTPTGFLNAFEFREVFNDGTVPVTPADVSVTAIPGTGNRLSWRDIAYNEGSYRVYRAETLNGPFTELNPDATNYDDTSYIDTRAVAGTGYYYYIIGRNAVGNSPASDTVHVITGNNPPVISVIADVNIKTSRSFNTNFTVSDDPGETLTVTAENLPSFATLQHLGGSNYRITSNPGIDNTGWYFVTVKATDNNGSTTLRTFKINISDEAVNRTVLLNLSGTTPVVSAPWNNLQGDGSMKTVSNLKTDDNANTTISFSTLDNNIPALNRGFITGNNSGIVPDSVLSGGLASYGTEVKRFRLSGLDPTKVYSIGVVSSLNSGDKNTSTFTATGNGATQTILINGRYNNTTEGRFNGLIPTASGEINFTMTGEGQVPGSDPWTILNALVIHEHIGLLRPVNLVATPVNTISKRMIQVTWSERSSTETGMEIQRSLTPDFSSLTAVMLPANTGTYIDSVLQPDTKYYYRVRAVTPGGNTAFSNASSAITAASIVYVNLTNQATAPAPWNNTSKIPVNGDVFANLKNDLNQNSGISLVIDSSFQAAETSGYYSAANAGILPSSVVVPNYTLNKNQVVKLRLTGLDAAKSYRIGFSGSTGAFGVFNTSYTIGSRTVYLNAFYNSNKLVYISDVVPNLNGEIVMTVSTTSNTGYLNALVIEQYTGVNGPVTQSPVNRIASGQDLMVQELPSALSSGIAAIYPNPFRDFINVDLVTNAHNSKVNVEVYDLNGRMVYSQQFGNIIPGKNTLRIHSINPDLSAGVYMLRLKVDGKTLKSVKLVKAAK